MLVLVCFRIPLFHIFVTDENVVEIGLKMMATMAPFYWLFVFTEVFSGALRGMGDVVVPMLITTGGICSVWYGFSEWLPSSRRSP